jgi:hypothetical protein
MTAKILQFPEPIKTTGYKIPLYTDEEIFLTITAVNIFCPGIKYKVTQESITDYDPTLIIDALHKASSSDLFSHKTKSVIIRILRSVENIEIRL